MLSLLALLLYAAGLSADRWVAAYRRRKGVRSCTAPHGAAGPRRDPSSRRPILWTA